MDEFHIVLQPPIKRIWTQVKRPRITRYRKRGKRNRVSLFVGITLQGDLTVLTAPTANNQAFGAWVEKFLQRYAQCSRVYLILDHASYHNLGWYDPSAPHWFRRVKLVGLPKYCPELNLAEQLGRVIKRELGYSYFETVGQMREVIDQFDTNSLPSITKKIREKYGAI